MAFYIRKAFRAGPIRFNLSKSGLGISAGVKGLRVGTGPRGAYVHGGRHGLYYRKYGGSSRQHKGAVERDPHIEFDQIEVTPESSEARANDPAQPSLLWPIIPGIVLIVLAIFTTGETQLGVGFVGFVATGVGAFISWGRHVYAKKINSYLALIEQISKREDPQLLESSRAAKAEGKFQREHVEKAIGAAYRRAVAEFMVERVDEPNVRQWLSCLAQLLDISEGEKATLEAEAFRELTWCMLADDKLTPEEEDVLGRARSLLGISDVHISEEIAAIDEFRRAREVGEGRLPQIEAGINLQRNEICHHCTQGALMDKKVTRTYISAGRRYKEEALMPTKEGDIYVTSKRLLIMGDGVSSIRHEKILDVEVDFDKKLVTIIKDGRQKPLYLTVPDPILTASLIERLSQQA